MNVSPGMTDIELQKFIDKDEQFFHEPGELYNKLINAGYPKEKIDAFILEKKRRENRKFRATLLFLSFILTCLGILSITGYFDLGQGIFEVLTGVILCILALFFIKRAFR